MDNQLTYYNNIVSTTNLAKNNKDQNCTQDRESTFNGRKPTFARLGYMLHLCRQVKWIYLYIVYYINVN